MTEDFPKAVKNDKGSNNLDTKEHLDNYASKSKNGLVCKGLKDLHHFNQHDMTLFNPLTMYWIERQTLPHWKFSDFYLMNVWLAMEFLESHNLCTNPQF